MLKKLGKFTKHSSTMVLIMLMSAIAALRLVTLVPDHISWDVFGYYIYLPSIFYQHDFLMTDISWIEDLMSQYQISDTLYQIKTGPKGEPVALFLLGMAILYAPFFGIGHLFAWLLGYPLDGLSLPFQYALSLGFLIYTFIGLWYVHKILKHYFSDLVVALTLVILVLGTNYFHFAAIKNLETSNALFTCLAVLIWHTIKWTETQKTKDLVIMAAMVSLSTLIKPSEIVCFLIPLFWGVTTRADLGKKFALIRKNSNQFVIAILLGAVMFLPQLFYWKANTGYFIYDSYVNPGIGLDLSSPHIANVLFSFKKGWLIYTPIMAFALGGFYFLFRKNKKIFAPILIYFLVTFYIISSWTEWWYGAGFSIRPLVTSYAALAIPLAAFVERLLHANRGIALFFFLVASMLIALNQFQQWQFRHYIIDPYRMNRAYYLASFGKTHISAKTKQLLDINRSFSGTNQIEHPKKYKSKSIGFYDFSEDDPGYNQQYKYDTLTQNSFFTLDGEQRYSPNIMSTYSGLTSESHAWIQASVDVFLPPGYHGPEPLLIITFQHDEQNYEYKTHGLEDFRDAEGKWVTIQAMYLTPHPRSTQDLIKIYVWHRGNQKIYIDNLKAFALEPKKSWQIRQLDF